MMFPELYQRLIAETWRTGDCLRTQERRWLPISHSATLAQLLTTWGVPADVALPLKYVADDFSLLARLAEPVRTKAELMKLAVLVSRLAVEQWEPWDVVELPAAPTLERLRLADLGPIVSRVRDDVAKLASFCAGRESEARPAVPRTYRPVVYCNLAAGRTDPFAQLLPSLGLEPAPIGVDELRGLDFPVIVNGLEAPATRLAAARVNAPIWVVTTPERIEAFSRITKSVSLPASFRCLRDSIHEFQNVSLGPPPDSMSEAARLRALGSSELVAVPHT